MMWVFTRHGFISIAQHLHHEDCFQVKARVAYPLQMLWPDHELQVIEWADYRYRINISKEKVFPVMDEIFRGIDYSNFKSQCFHMEDYHHALMDVWTKMYQYQSRMEGDA